MTNLTNIQAQKGKQKISVLTAYDALFAQVVENSGVDIMLVGDSLGMVIQGDENTLSVSMSDMLYHTKIVAKKCINTLLIVDMPYQSYQTPKMTLANAIKLLGSGADIVKLEGGVDQVDNIKILIDNDIAVCGHLGLQPQSIKEVGGYKMQGKTQQQADKILSDAKLLTQNGVALLVLECIPNTLAKTITQSIKIPTIGIGAGADCDGQVLVSTDILGLGKMPKFAKNFLADTKGIIEAVNAFDQAVKNQTFP